MSNHSEFGPSGAYRWLNCPGSYNATKDLPEETSEFAAEGTDAHELAEICLTQKRTARSFIGTSPLINKERIIDEDMAHFVQQYVDYVLSVGGDQEYEQEVSYEEWVPGGFGTADVIAVDGDDLHVMDLKYGKGVQVFAEDNPQGMLYALGALSERAAFQSFKDIHIHIIQPRLDHISDWSIKPVNLLAWADWVKKQAALCLQPDAPRIPGEKQCRFCRAKATCTALKKQTETALLADFDSMNEPPAPETLTEKQLKTVIDNKAMIEQWLKSVEAHVMGRIENGKGFPGYKIVEGRSNRKWANELEAEKLLRSYLGEDAYNKKLKSVAQAEKALGKEKKKDIQDFIIKPQGKPALVPEDDKRPPISLGITVEDFN